MKRTTLVLIMAIFSLIWGVGFILVPEQVWSLYGIKLDAGGMYISRELGAVFFMLGAILWFARKDQGLPALRGILIGLFIGNLLGFAVTVIGQLTTPASALGWAGAGIYLLLALGFGYFIVSDSEEVSRPAQI